MLKPVADWLNEYDESHRNPANKLIHWICVPLIMLSAVAMLWSIPVPSVFRETSPILNWGTLFILVALVYYFVMSFSLALGMVIFVALLMAADWWLAHLHWPLWETALVIFVAAWIGQFIGHKIEGRKPSFFKDLQFLLIGPLWLVAFIYRRVGIPY